jgi:CheY-like chemotaxis protein
MILTVVDRHEVEVAEGGEEALAMFKTGTYDLVVTDFRMGGMDGLVLARAIRALSPAQPIILVTAHIEALPDSQGSVADVNVTLGKPFSVAELREAVARLLPAPEL